MGRINDTTKYPQDESLSGTENLLGSDDGGATRLYELNDIADFAADKLGRLKRPTSSTYDGFLIISGEGNANDLIVEAGDILIGANAALTSGQVMVLQANINTPSVLGDFTVRLNLG